MKRATLQRRAAALVSVAGALAALSSCSATRAWDHAEGPMAEQTRESDYAARTATLLQQIMPGDEVLLGEEYSGRGSGSGLHIVSFTNRRGADVGCAVWEIASGRLVQISANHAHGPRIERPAVATEDATSIALYWAVALGLVDGRGGAVRAHRPTWNNGYWGVRIRDRGDVVSVTVDGYTGAFSGGRRWRDPNRVAGPPNNGL